LFLRPSSHNGEATGSTVMLHYLMHCVFNWHTYPEGPGEETFLFCGRTVGHTGMNVTLYFLFTFFYFSFISSLFMDGGYGGVALLKWLACMVKTRASISIG